MELRGEASGTLTARSTLRCLVDGGARGSWNMAVDEALMASARRGVITLRLYGWEPGCLSFGRNQTARGRYDRRLVAQRGIDVVRRPTGGRAVYHERELTYSVTGPAEAWGSLREAYRRINHALTLGLRRLGVPAAVADGANRSPPRPSMRACFRDPVAGEVVAAGRKLVGSAQWRRDGAVLQHGSILLYNDQRLVEELRTGGPAAPPAVPAASLAELLGSLPSRNRLVEYIAAGFEEELGLPASRDGLSTEERSLARRRESRYGDAGWTWRR